MDINKEKLLELEVKYMMKKIPTNILFVMIKQALKNQSLRDAQIRHFNGEKSDISYYEWAKTMYELCNLKDNNELKETKEYKEILSILRDKKLEQLGI